MIFTQKQTKNMADIQAKYKKYIKNTKKLENSCFFMFFFVLKKIHFFQKTNNF